MKVVVQILIFKCLLCIALASLKNRIQKFPDSSSEEKIRDYNVKDILKKTQDVKNFEFYQNTVHTLKANDRRKDYVKYYFRNPSKTDEDDSSDSSSSYDSSESLESELKSDSNNFEKSKHRQTEDENSKSSSSEESEPCSHDKNVHEADKEENSKIKSLLIKLNKSFHNKKASSVKDKQEVDEEQIFRESKIMKWREIEIAVKLLLISNYKYTKKVLQREIFNTTQSNQHGISGLKQKILQEYYLLKKDVSQMAKLAKKKCKKVVKELGKKKTYEVEQLFFSQFKDQINQKVVIFKQNIKSAIDQWQLESKPTSSTDAKYSKTTDTQKVQSVKQPIYHEIDLPPVVSITSAVNITADDVLKILWTENGENSNDLDGAVILKQGFNEKSNIKTTFGIQSSIDIQTSRQQNENSNGIINKENKLTDTSTDAKNLSFKIGALFSTNVTSKIASSAISSDPFLEPLKENSGNQLHEGTTVRNEQDLRYFSQDISARFVASNIVKNNGKDNQVDNNFNMDTGLAQQKPPSSVNDELVKSKSQPSASIHFYVTQRPHETADIGSQKNKVLSHITDSEFEDSTVSLNTNAVEISSHHSGSINDQIVADYVNIRHENFTNINKTKTLVESEINMHPPLDLTETSVSDKKLEPPDVLGDFSNVDNKITLTKNITTSEHVTSNAVSDIINKINQIAGTLMTNNKSISDALGHSNMKDNSPSIYHHIKTPKSNSIVKDDQINSTINTNFTRSTTPKVTDFIYSTESLVSTNKVGYRENKTNSNTITQKSETIELTNTGTLSQRANDPNSTEIKTNFDPLKGSISNSNYKNNSHISGNDGISNNKVVNYTQNSNDYQIEQSINVTPTNFTEIKINDRETRQHSNNNQMIINHLQGNGNFTLNNSQKKINYQKPNERNNISTSIPMENKYTSNTTFSNVNGTYDHPKSKSIDNVTSDSNALNNNKSIMDTGSQRRFTKATKNLSANSPHNNFGLVYSHTTQHPNHISPSTTMDKLGSSGNFDGQNQKHTISINATENMSRESQSVKPIDGNIENLPEQVNVDVIPHGVNAENFQNANDTNEEVEVVFTKSNSIETTNDYEVGKSIDSNNSLNVNTFTTHFEQIPFELQNIKNINNEDNSGKERDVNGPTSDIHTTLLYLNSPTPPNNTNKANITHHKTINQLELETTTENHLDNDFDTTVAAINTYSTNKLSDYLLPDYNTKSTLIKNAIIISTYIPVTEININEILTRTSTGSSIQNQHSDKYNSFNNPFEPVAEQSTKITEVDQVTIVENNDVIKTQSEKTIQIDLTDSDNHYNELPFPHSTTTIKKSENQIIFDDPTKIILNKTSKVDSSRYGNEEIAVNSTKVSDSGYLFIDAASHLDTTTNKNFYTGLEIETVTKNESQIINTSIPTPQIETEPTESMVASIVTSEEIITDITTKGTTMSTTINPVNKINTNECKDDKGTIVDCESNIENTNTNENENENENEKSTVNVWPGIPDECLPLFLASDGTVLREIPSIVNISDAQTRNLCVSIAITIIQLNSSPTLL